MGTKRASDKWSNAIAAQIRAERAAAGITQAEMFSRAGLPKSTYIRIETGERVPDVNQTAKIAQAFGLRFSELTLRAEVRMEHAAGMVTEDPGEDLGGMSQE